MSRATAAAVALVWLAISPWAHAGPAADLGEAYRALSEGDYDRALRLGKRLPKKALRNQDYADYVVGQAALLAGEYRTARARFGALAANRSSRFQGVAAWRLADAEWALGNAEGARKRYEALLRSERRSRHPDGDHAIARWRIALAHRERNRTDAAIAECRELLRHHPQHPLAETARQTLGELTGEADVALTPDDRIARAERLTEARLWREAIAELDCIGDDVPVETARQRDFQMGRTLFKMRRQYKLAGELLLSVYQHMGAEADWAMFHGARALSRQHFDEEAIQWYLKMVDAYPRSEWADEAQYLSGWLEFNLRHYAKAIPHLEKLLDRHPRSKWTDEAVWYLGLSYFLMGEYDSALPLFERHGKRRDKLEGGQGQYWHARALQKLDRTDDANAEYRSVVGQWPFSWYALLSRARLKEQGIDIGPFGDTPPSGDNITPIASNIDPKLAADPLIRAVDELIDAGLPEEAAVELRRGERAFLRRFDRAAAMAMIMDRYHKANNFNRPWMLAVVRGGRALNVPPKGTARIWWEHAYPLAYRELVEQHREVGKNPPYWLYSIMRKESGFEPHTVSYADALGLLQMIPPTTRRVVKQLGMAYTDDLLFDPSNNIKLGSWYIGRLFRKFKGQVPIASSAYNAGPRAVMRWLRLNGDRPLDEYQELVSYQQARGYGKKVTETYARYLYLYEGEVLDLPLTVDAAFVVDNITY